MLFVVRIEALSSRSGWALKTPRTCSSKLGVTLLHLPGGKSGRCSGTHTPPCPFSSPHAGLGWCLPISPSRGRRAGVTSSHRQLRRRPGALRSNPGPGTFRAQTAPVPLRPARTRCPTWPGPGHLQATERKGSLWPAAPTCCVVLPHTGVELRGGEAGGVVVHIADPDIEDQGAVHDLPCGAVGDIKVNLWGREPCRPCRPRTRWH